MLTVTLIVVVLVALVSIIGGFAMMNDKSNCFFTWYMGFRAFSAGFEILVGIVPAIFAAICDSNN